MPTRRNTLALGSAIVAALEAALPAHMPEVRAVLRAQDLAGVQEAEAPTPALHVLSADEEVGDSWDDGRLSDLDQRWLVVVAVRYVARTRGEEAEQLAGELRGAVCDALQGRRLLDGYGPLHRIAGPAPVHRPGGYSYYPLRFAAHLIGGAQS